MRLRQGVRLPSGTRSFPVASIFKRTRFDSVGRRSGSENRRRLLGIGRIHLRDSFLVLAGWLLAVELIQYGRDQSGPTGLMAGPVTGSCIGIEEFVEKLI